MVPRSPWSSPSCTVAGGIERVCWDLLDYLGPRHETAWVGTFAPEGTPRGVSLVPVGGPLDPGPTGHAAPPGPHLGGGDPAWTLR